MEGKYKYLTFTAGHIDKSGKTSALMEISFDGELYTFYIIEPDELPSEICIPVKGVNQIEFSFRYSEYNGYPKIGIANPMLTTDEISENKLEEIDSIQYGSGKKYLGNEIKAYDDSDSRHLTEHDNSNELFEMGGEIFLRGITHQAFAIPEYTLYNLEGKYKKLEFTAGITNQGASCIIQI